MQYRQRIKYGTIRKIIEQLTDTRYSKQKVTKNVSGNVALLVVHFNEDLLYPRKRAKNYNIQSIVFQDDLNFGTMKFSTNDLSVSILLLRANVDSQIYSRILFFSIFFQTTILSFDMVLKSF